MGTVYRAAQTEPVKRPVALKLIKIGMDSRAVLARFDAERQALALMDHPNIARVYDGGTTAVGQPFFVMELVSGVPITEYCDRHRLSVRARLELFVAVCHAVQHAHQKGIIHRDLKPSNILVAEMDGRPTPKVIDFGVAKATEQRLTDLSLLETGAIVGTPAYMSPEQADPSSRDIDTRTDVYALGVILYELLAGSPPIDAKQFRRGAILEMLRMVREIDPPRPSTKVSTSDALPSIAASRGIEPSQLKQLLRGDLDWIVMKALEKDRARRYETANGFAADVLRHLAHEPVLAAPPSRAYRVRKFVRKHRGAVVAVSLVVLALLAGIAGTTWGLIRAVRARAAEAERVTERDAALGKARDAERSAEDRADKLKYQLGVSDFLLASAAYDNRDVVLAAERLGNVPPAQRGWEWRYLKRLTRGGLFTLYGHSGTVSSAGFSPDGARIVTASNDRTAKVWDARTGAQLLELKGHTGRSAGFSPDGTRIVTGGGVAENQPGEVTVWDARSGSLLLELKGHTNPVASAAFSPDGTRIVTGSADRTAKVWDARSGSALLGLKGHTGTVVSAAFSPDGARIVTASDDRTAKVWDARTGTPLLELKGHPNNWLRSAAFSPDGTRIVTASWDQTAKVWDTRAGTPLLELKGHTSEVTRAWFSPDGARIVTASVDQTVKVSDARSGTQLLELKGQTDEVSSVGFSPDGDRIVTASGFGPVKVWDARAGTQLLELKGHKGWVNSVGFSPDGIRIVTASVDQTTKVWDARSGEELKGEPIPPAPRSSPISPDGRLIAHPAGNRVELISLQPDEEELSYRRLLTRPNFRLYREAYDAAIESKDDFAARFHLNLFPQAERTRIRAEMIVKPLFARLLLRQDVLAALQAQPAADPEIHAACLNLAGTWPESASDWNEAGWRLVRDPGQPDATYQRGLRLAKDACRLEPDDGQFLNTLGVAQYRCGLVAEALATLTRSNGLNGGNDRADLAFLALAQHRLGQAEKARATLGRLREVIRNSVRTGDSENQAFLREAEAIDLDAAFPADPFAR
jgi:WD40 repeat protein